MDHNNEGVVFTSEQRASGITHALLIYIGFTHYAQGIRCVFYLCIT